MICPSCKYEYTEKYIGEWNKTYEAINGDERPIRLYFEHNVSAENYGYSVYLFACPKCKTVIMHNDEDFIEY